MYLFEMSTETGFFDCPFEFFAESRECRWDGTILNIFEIDGYASKEKNYDGYAG